MAEPRAGGRQIVILEMAPSELDRIGEVDRTEHVTEEYAYRDGALARRAVDVRIRPWTRLGDDDRSVQGMAKAWMPILEQGGALLGAFEGERLVGFAIHRPRLDDATSCLTALYVSSECRRQGVAGRLLDEVIGLARADGARRLYASATPSRPTVDFYLRHGFRPTDEPDPRMFAAEPDDIHMILEL